MPRVSRDAAEANTHRIRLPVEVTEPLGPKMFRRGGRYAGTVLAREIGVTGNSTLWVWMHKRGLPVAVAMRVASQLRVWAQELNDIADSLVSASHDVANNVTEELNRLRDSETDFLRSEREPAGVAD